MEWFLWISGWVFFFVFFLNCERPLSLRAKVVSVFDTWEKKNCQAHSHCCLKSLVTGFYIAFYIAQKKMTQHPFVYGRTLSWNLYIKILNVLSLFVFIYWPTSTHLGLRCTCSIPKGGLVNATLPREHAPLRVHVPISFHIVLWDPFFFLLLLPHLITEDLLKYSSAMYHCAPFSRRVLHTLPLRLPSATAPLCLSRPKCYTTMTTAARVPGFVPSCNRISCHVGTSLLRQRWSPLHPTVCEEVVSFCSSPSGREEALWERRGGNRTERREEILEIRGKDGSSVG